MKRFIDEAVITVQSGDGGQGCVSFRREKYVPRGGPDGGDGGNGGHVYIRAVEGLQTLSDFRYRRFFKARNGTQGRGKSRTGADGEDVVIEVPLGTLVYDEEGGGLLADLVGDKQTVVLVQGGKGGKGNQHFVSSTNRAPRYAQPGLPGEKRRIRLSLKLIADVGLIGLPNAGKSTLLSRLTMARPRIAEYPFTTLVPQLGVMCFSGDRFLTFADIPGLIEGASRGRGLGHRFLKHVERTRMFFHMIDITGPSEQDILNDFDVLNRELGTFDPRLLEKDQVVLMNKIDLLSNESDRIRDMGGLFQERGVEALPVSALTGEGLDGMRRLLERKFFKNDENPDMLEQDLHSEA
jgi:GTP-binding protein